MTSSTRAIVLGIRPWSKTSHMVTWLTPEGGKLVTSVKGACRPKSAFLGQYDLFYTCDLVYYSRDHGGTHVLRECCPTQLREGLRTNWRACVAAAHLADLTARAAQPHQESHAIFDLLEHHLDHLANLPPGAPLRALVLHYELHLLRLLGLQPDFTACPHCLQAERPLLRFSISSGHFVCEHRPGAPRSEATVPIHPRVRELFQVLASTSAAPGASAPPPACGDKESAAPQNLVFGLSRFLGMFMAFHLDVPPVVRRTALEMMDTTPAQATALLETRTL